MSGHFCRTDGRNGHFLTKKLIDNKLNIVFGNSKNAFFIKKRNLIKKLFIFITFNYWSMFFPPIIK